jgi:hypothetical protein
VHHGRWRDVGELQVSIVADETCHVAVNLRHRFRPWNYGSNAPFRHANWRR